MYTICSHNAGTPDKNLASEMFGRLQNYIDLSFNYVFLKMFHLEITQWAL